MIPPFPSVVEGEHPGDPDILVVVAMQVQGDRVVCLIVE